MFCSKTEYPNSLYLARSDFDTPSGPHGGWEAGRRRRPITLRLRDVILKKPKNKLGLIDVIHIEGNILSSSGQLFVNYPGEGEGPCYPEKKL
jgi:hypothetical protein